MTTVERALERQRLKGLVRKVLAKIQGRTLYPTSGSNQINVHLKKGLPDLLKPFQRYLKKTGQFCPLIF
jgi:hypothetical protein